MRVVGSTAVVVALIGCASGGGAEATESALQTERRSVDLRAEDGTTVQLEYSVEHLSGASDRRTVARRILLRVDRTDWHVGGRIEGKSVRAVLMSLCTPSGGGREGLAYDKQLEVPLASLSTGAGAGYELRLTTRGDDVDTVPISMTSIAGANRCRQEIAVVIDGSWLVDPINGTHNFRFELAP